ncbi:hypothetical protein [Agrobacterium sp. DE0009]|uniref:hypothetical protein n=1 Tax=Agrobacterium sp. DE0009 TaxID=2587505 RepID=UPI0011A489E5|nr:hypothetical protein [Agrobacterium sp. DE0009]
MIRHQFDIAAVEEAVAELDANWLNKARKRTAKFIAQKAYEEASSIWSTVKPVYMRLQHDKCVFCEQRLEGGAYGPVTWDLEHFRPKSNVDIWPDPTRHSDLIYTNIGTASANGYYWLAYELRNYAASCKVCNSIFKLNWFPIAAVRALSETDAVDQEQAFLCYPLGEGDLDPEELITFTLTTAVPTHREGPLNLRGRIIIDFFGLNKRDTLHRDRAQMIGSIGMLLEERDRGTASAEKLAAIEQLNGPHVPHAACVRAFKRLWEVDAVAARRGYEMCLAYGFDLSRAPPAL